MSGPFVPSLDPRGTDRPKTTIVRTSETLLGVGLFHPILWLLDFFGRGESAVDIYKLLPRALGFIGSPLFSVVLMILGFLSLWKFARASEKAKIGQIVHPYTKQPIISPVYPAFRRSTWSAAVALLAAFTVWSFYKTPVRDYVVVDTFTFPLLRVPAVPEDALKPGVPYNDAYLEILHNHKKLNGQSLIAEPRVINVDVQLRNTGTAITLKPASARLYLNTACTPTGQQNQVWQVVASDEPDFISEFYFGPLTSIPGSGLPINAQETWSWPPFVCLLNSDLTGTIKGMMKVFYGSPEPSEASFTVRSKEAPKETSKPISQ